MADIATAPLGKRKRSANLKVDFTPLVDLGFLLITFFVFTSRLSTPVAMQAMLPKDGAVTAIRDSEAITLIPDAEGFYYYAGLMPAQANDIQFVPYLQLAQFRAYLTTANQLVAAKHLPNHNLMVIIKPTNNSQFGKVITLLDEMNINAIQSYALTEATELELAMIAQQP